MSGLGDGLLESRVGPWDVEKHNDKMGRWITGGQEHANLNFGSDRS